MPFRYPLIFSGWPISLTLLIYNVREGMLHRIYLPHILKHLHAAAAAAASKSLQSCPTLSDRMDCSPPGSSIHGIFQARVLEWGVIAFFWACLVPYFSKNPVKSQFSHNPLSSIIWSSLVTDQIPYTYVQLVNLCERWREFTILCLQFFFKSEIFSK